MPAKRPQDNQASSANDSSTSRTSSSDLASTSASGKSSEEIRETVKEAVGKGVAAVAGVADGINETMEQTHLDETAEKAIRQVGETTSKVVSAARESVDEVRSAVKGEPSPTGSSPDSGIGLAGSYHGESSLSGRSSSAASSFGSDTTGVSEPYALASQEEE
jgi:hypothetical protein